MPARKSPKSTGVKRKSYPKRKSVRSTVLQRARTMEYAADPAPPYAAATRSTKEQKFLDLPLTSPQCSAYPLPADMRLLNQIGQGTSVNTRIGMRYQLTGVHIRGLFKQEGVQMTTPAIAGYYLVYDSEPHGELATVQEMFNLRFNDMHYAFPNGSEGQKGGRFKYLARKEYLLGNQGAGTNAIEMDGVHSGTRLVDDYIPLNKLPVQCMRLNTGSTISTIQKGALLLVPFGLKGAPITGSASNPTFVFSWRLYFNE